MLHGSMPNYYSESLQLEGCTQITTQGQLQQVSLALKLGAPHQQLLDVAHTSLFLGSYTLQEYSVDGFREH
jgi:hypothetical protein